MAGGGQEQRDVVRDRPPSGCPFGGEVACHPGKHPDERVAWTSVGGQAEHAGVVTFHRLDEAKTRVMIQIDWDNDRTDPMALNDHTDSACD